MGKALSQKEVAELLGLTTRQVRNLVDQGMPTESVAGKVTYPWPAALRWYIAFKVEAEAREEHPKDVAEAERRKKWADAVLAELAVAEKEGTLIAAQVHEEVVGELADRMRGVLQNIASNYMVDLERAGVESKVAQQVLDKIALDLTGCLRAAADDLDAD